MKRLWRPLILLSPLLPLLLYFRGAWYDLTEPYSLSMLLGIPAYIYLMNSLVLATRLKALDRIAGHDRVLAFHRQLAGLSLALALLHGIVKSRVFPLTLMPAPLGGAALLITLGAGGGALLFLKARPRGPGGRSGPDYSRVKTLHNLTVPAALIAALHVLMASTTAEQGNRMLLMGLWGALAMGLWIRHKLIKPFLLRARGNCILELNRLNDDVLEVRLDRKGFGSYRAGQFAYLRFPGSPGGGEEHPFTLSSAPSQGELAVTVKALGDFTRGMRDLTKGSPALIDGPYGLFCPDQSRPMVLLAGGIGITPFLSALRELVSGCRFPVVLIWSVRRQDDLVFDEELRALEDRYAVFTYCPTLSGEKSSKGEQGRIDGDMILRHTEKGMREEALWYCCGPPDMIGAMEDILRGMGIPKRHVRTEKFSY